MGLIASAMALLLFVVASGAATAAPPQFTYEYKAGFIGAGNDVIPPETAPSIQVHTCTINHSDTLENTNMHTPTLGTRTRTRC